jgi:hypothetical protein
MISEKLDKWRERWVAANKEKARCYQLHRQSFEGFVADRNRGIERPADYYREQGDAVMAKTVESCQEIDRLIVEYVALTNRRDFAVCIHGWEWPCVECEMSIESATSQIAKGGLE